jgi:hypothetical protein
MQEWFVPNLIETDLLVLGKTISNDFLYIKTCKNSFPYCGTSQPLGTIIWTSSSLHYVRKLNFKAKWFVKRRSLNDPTPFVEIISPLKKTWPFEYKTNTIPILMHQMRISTNQVSSVVLRPKKLKYFLILFTLEWFVPSLITGACLPDSWK